MSNYTITCPVVQYLYIYENINHEHFLWKEADSTLDLKKKMSVDQ